MNDDRQDEAEIGDVDAAHAAVVRKIVEPSPHDLVIQVDLTEERNFGWVVRLAPREYLETGDRRHMVPGVGLVVVTREGNVLPLPSSLPPAQAVAIFEQIWEGAQPSPR